MALLQNIKLRYQLVILVSIGILMLIVVQSFYYVRSTRDTVQKANGYAQSILGQMQDKANNIAENIEKAGVSIAYNPTVQRFMARRQGDNPAEEVNNLLSSIIQINSNISGISLLSTDGQVMSSSDYSEFGTSICGMVKRQFLGEPHEKAFFTPLFVVERSKLSKMYYTYIVPIYSITEDLQIKNRIGVCILYCRPDMLQVDIRSASVSENSVFCVVDSKQIIVASSKQGMAGKPFDEKAVAEAGIDTPKAGDGKYISLSTPIADMGWQIVSLTSVYELTSDLRQVRNSVMVISIVAIVLFLGVGWVFIRSMTMPITQIISQAREIGDENLNLRISTNVTNEIGVIAGNINHMLDRIEFMNQRIFDMQTRLYESELSKKEAEFMALESQINPHFLYNTLECIQIMGLELGSREIAEITSAMANIFRYSIKGAHFAPIRDELRCMSNYLKIITYRYLDKVSYTIDVDERLMDVRIVKMILQPILENAVNHGLENKQGKGRVEIKGCLHEDNVIFQIIDDGVGMSAQELEELNRSIDSALTLTDRGASGSRGIGLANIQRRIKHNYGDAYGMVIHSIENEGTTVTIEIPIRQEMPNHGKGVTA